MNRGRGGRGGKPGGGPGNYARDGGGRGYYGKDGGGPSGRGGGQRGSQGGYRGNQGGYDQGRGRDDSQGQGPKLETWTMPPPRSNQKIAPLPAPAECEPFPEPKGVIPLQKPKSPGEVTFANITCSTNYYELKLGDEYSVAYFYNVEISKVERETGATSRKPTGSASRVPRKEFKLGRRLSIKVFAEIPREELGDQLLAYDGSQRACGIKRIPNDALDTTVTYDGDKWRVTVQYDKSVPLEGVKEGASYGLADNEEEALLFLALVVKLMPSTQYTPIGRGFYGLGEDPIPIEGGFELWAGYKAHVIPGAEKLYLNVNHALTTFIKPGKMIDLLPDLINSRGERPSSLHPGYVYQLRNKLTNCRAETWHLQTVQEHFKITTITDRPASKQFMCRSKDGSNITVAEYFRQMAHTLTYPEWPCVQVGQGNKAKYYPLEVVRILNGNHFSGEQDGELLKRLIRFAAIKPQSRLEKIREIVKILRKRSMLDEFDLDLGEELEVPARIIPVPKLKAGRGKDVRVDPGVIDFKSNTFFSAAQIDRWTVIITDERAPQKDVRQLADTLRKQASNMGLMLGEPFVKPNDQFHFISDRLALDKVEKSIEDFLTEYNLDFVLFVISEKTRIHAAIKFTCDVKLGVSSKCIKSSTIRKILDNKFGPDQCVVNILYGLNPKFDGENVVGVSTEFAQNLLSTCPVLIIGMDVNHGQAKVRARLAKMPSTVGIVGTRNTNATLYNAYMRAQRKPEKSDDTEIIQPQVLKPAMDKIVRSFIAETRQKPQRVIVYRDGVSNGQFNAVLQKEMRVIDEVCQEVCQERVPITFITVQKRHDTRLFPTKATVDRKNNQKQNPIAGTVVDQIMTVPNVWNFFLVSHEGIQGTSKPAHYTVLFDENNFSNDQLQSLTYYLCHLYGKCPRAVSLPAPAYYAHHVAFRAAELGSFKYFSLEQRARRSVEEEELSALEEYNAAGAVKENYAASMYFL